MFATHPQHKLPLQFPGDPTTVWTGVEVVLHFPFFLCKVDVEGESLRFFLTQEEDVLRMAAKTTDERLVAVDLVVPPESSEGAVWEVLPVARIMRRRTPRAGEPRIGLVLETRAGLTYAGFPLQKVEAADPRSLILVADFDVRGMAAGSANGVAP